MTYDEFMRYLERARLTPDERRRCGQLHRRVYDVLENRATHSFITSACTHDEDDLHHCYSAIGRLKEFTNHVRSKERAQIGALFIYNANLIA